jgi:cytochrome c biogenesis protein CcmG/thiol:disulfide interchange protein DsbE
VVGIALALTLDLSPEPAPSASTIVIGRHPLLDRPAPEIALPALDGDEVRLSALRGRPVLVNFWASWCIPCREEFPLFKAALADPDNADLEILGVVYEDSEAAAEEFMRAQAATWPALSDAGGAVADTYGVVAPPMTFYVDREGVVRALSFGPPPEDVFQQYLDRIR